MALPNPTLIRAREIVVMLKAAEGPDVAIDRAISQLMQRPMISWTFSLDNAKNLVPKYYQRGSRQYPSDDCWGVYVEVNSTAKRGFVWANHRSEVNALLIAALLSRIYEME